MSVASTSTGIGIFSQTSNSTAIQGTTTSTSAFADGVRGKATVGNGVFGESSSAGASGVYGFNSGGFGVAGRTDSGTGVYGEATGGGWAGLFAGPFHVNGNITATGTITPNNPSDQRLKKNIQPMQDSLTKVMGLKGVTFEWKDPAKHGNQTGSQFGFIAQDVEKVFPAWVSKTPDGFKSVLHLRAVDAVFVESIRSLKTENDQLRSRIESLEAKRSLAKAAVADSPLMLGALGLVGLAFVLTRRRNRQPRA